MTRKEEIEQQTFVYYETVSTDENYDNYVDFDLDKMVEDFKKVMND